MRADQKKKALEQLAQVPGDSTLSALNDEAQKIERIFEAETQYDVLEEQLELFDTFAFRVNGTAVAMIASLIQRLGTFKLTYSGDWADTALDPARYQNTETLTIKAIEILNHLRYWETERVLKLLLDLSDVENGNIRKKAVEELERLAKYDLAVFYGPERKGGIGAAPQKVVIDQIDAFKESELRNYREGIIAVAAGLLSSTMESTSGTYKTVTWSRAPVPAHPDVVEIRQRTIALLKRLYELATTAPSKAHIIGTLNEATRHHMSGSGEDVRQMIAKNTIDILVFFIQIAASENFPVVQKVETNSYWIFYHASDEKVKQSALAIEATISKNAEYQIYKQLIGFEGIFGKWSSLSKRDRRWDAVEKYRKRKASRYARSIAPENYDEWRQRILRFTQTESDDLATFPIFYQFLEEFAKFNPKLAFKLLLTDAEPLQRFLIPLLRGLWGSEGKAKIRTLIKEWISERKYLYQCTKMFMGNDDLDREILSMLLDTGKQTDNCDVLTLIVSVAVSNYSEDKKFLLTDLMMPAIEGLSDYHDTRWLNEIWYRRESRTLFGAINEQQIDLILANLIQLNKIDYHAEEILAAIARRFPVKILNFFGDRLKVYEQKENTDQSVFDAVPFEFHKVNEPLSKIPAEAVSIVRSWYDGDYSGFIYSGARLLKNIYPDFPEAFKSELIKLVRAGGEDNLLFVLAILRNYEGEIFLHPVCKEIVCALPSKHEMLEDVMIALESTGVLSGEFGVAEAYERKANEVSDWLSDPDEKISAFARKYVEGLQSMSASERKRAEEEIELRKYRFGE